MKRPSHDTGRAPERLGSGVVRLHGASLDRHVGAVRADRGGLAALSKTDVGPACARPVLPGAAEGDRPRTDRVARVAADGVGAAGGRLGFGVGTPGRTGTRSPWPRLPLPTTAPVVLPTTGDVGASLADVSTPQPVAIAEQASTPVRADSPGGTAQRVAASTAPPASLSFQAWIMLGWAFCVVLLLARFLRAMVATCRLIREAEPLRAESLPIDVAALQRAVGLRVPVRWAVNFDLNSPAVGGLVRPVVVLPPDLSDSLTPKQLTWVLLHELAHIRRGDLWVVVVQRVVQAVFFFNPAVHLANWIIDELREYACDDAALAACKTSRRDCGEGFLAIVERSVERVPIASPALGLFESRC